MNCYAATLVVELDELVKLDELDELGAKRIDDIPTRIKQISFGYLSCGSLRKMKIHAASSKLSAFRFFGPKLSKIKDNLVLLFTNYTDLFFFGQKLPKMAQKFILDSKNKRGSLWIRELQ